MLNDKLIISMLLIFISVHINNYAMYCNESLDERTVQSSEYLEQIYFKIIFYIEIENVEFLRKLINEMHLELDPFRIKLLLNTIDKTTGLSPFTLAKNLPDGKHKQEIINILKNNGISETAKNLHRTIKKNATNSVENSNECPETSIAFLDIRELMEQTKTQTSKLFIKFSQLRKKQKSDMRIIQLLQLNIAN